MNMKDTATVQNILTRLILECELQSKDPSIKIKKQYFKAESALRNAVNEFDILNDMLDIEQKKSKGE